MEKRRESMFRRWRRLLTNASNAAYSALVPVGRRWERAQSRYIRWAESPMSPTYLGYVRIMGEEFSQFVGAPTRMIDVGCGNGVFGGMSYGEAGYLPLKRRGGYILGVDPLPLLKPIPWLSEFKQGKVEDLELSGFSEAAFVTTFDHIQDIDAALTNLKRAGVKTLFIWETLYRRHTRGDADHPHHYTYAELTALLNSNGFAVTRTRNVNEKRETLGIFIEAKRREQ